MMYIQKFYEQRFRADTSKEAYLRACKFVASNVISGSSKVEADKVTWDVVRVESESGLPTFLLTLYCKFDDTEFMKMSCEACKQFHKSFFVNQDYNCSRCNKIGYEKNIQQKLLIVSEQFKKILDNELDRLI